MKTRGGGGGGEGGVEAGKEERTDGRKRKGRKGGKGGRRRKDLVDTESFSIDVDSAVVAVCNSSFTLSESPERKETKGRGGRGRRRREGRTDGTTVRRGKTNGWERVPGGIQGKERRREGRKDFLGEKRRG